LQPSIAGKEKAEPIVFLPFFFLFFSKKLPTPWSLVPSHRHWCIGCNPYNPSTIDDQKGRNKIKKGKKNKIASLIEVKI